MKHRAAPAVLAALALTWAGCTAGSAGVRPEQRLTGGGSSFINPLMTQWAGSYYRAKGVQVDYTSSGSGNGVRQMIDRKNDFGCTDAPLGDEQRHSAEAAGGEVLHVPLVLGGVVPAYNLRDVREPLRFSGPVLADIFLGKITRWDDPRLRELNPGVSLPGDQIAVVHRSDGSGTTYIWADYLAKVSPEWKDKVGVGTDLKWPAGSGQPGNDGVAGQVGRTPGAIGYVELSYALKSGIPYGAVRNREGEFVRASLESITRAAENALTDVPEDLRYSLTDAPGPGSYPVSGTTWAVLYARQPSEAKAKALADFLRWATHDGQQATADLQYARLPPNLVQRVEEKIGRIQGP